MSVQTSGGNGRLVDAERLAVVVLCFTKACSQISKCCGKTRLATVLQRMRTIETQCPTLLLDVRHCC